MLTPQEQAELQALEQEEAFAFQKLNAQSPQGSGLTPQEQAELQMLEQEEMALQNQQLINPETEADLGFATRLKYSIEPLASNRKALLSQQFGPENIMEDPETGDVYIKQGGEFRPVNAPGISFTDVADFAGAIPESVGTAIGAGIGLGAGGIGAIPAAAAGGALGSAARQGISSLLGTPQVAEPQERAIEIGLSGAFGAGGAAIGKGVQAVGKKISPKIAKVFPDLISSKEGKEFAKLTKELNIPSPTKGQLVGGRDLQIEKALGEKPIFGAGIRRRVNKQVSGIKRNLKDIAGNFLDDVNDMPEAGAKIKDFADSTVQSVKQQSQQLFEQIADRAKNVTIPAESTRKEFLKKLSSSGLSMFDDAGNALNYNAKSGLSEGEFKRVQRVVGNLLEGMKNSENTLNVKDLNALRRTISGEIGDYAKEFKTDDVILRRLENSFLDVQEKMLDSVGEIGDGKKMSDVFKEARGLWAKYHQLNDVFSKSRGLNLKNMSDEKVLDHIFRESKRVDQFKDLVDEDTFKETAKTYVKNLLRQQIGGEDQIGAKRLLTVLREKKPFIKNALGSKEYEKVIKNLVALDRVGKTINPSETAKVGLREINLENLLSGALQLGERAARGVGRKASRQIMSTAKRAPQRLGGLGAILSDQYQDEIYQTRSPQNR